MVSFAMRKFVSLIRSHFFIFVFLCIALGNWPKKTQVQLMSEDVLPRSFLVSYLCVWCESVFCLQWFTCSYLAAAPQCHEMLP